MTSESDCGFTDAKVELISRTTEGLSATGGEVRNFFTYLSTLS